MKMAVAGGRGRNYGGGPEGGRACNSPRVTRPATSMKAAAAVAVAGGGGGENDRVPHKTLPSQSFTSGARVTAGGSGPCGGLAGVRTHQLCGGDA